VGAVWFGEGSSASAGGPSCLHVVRPPTLYSYCRVARSAPAGRSSGFDSHHARGSGPGVGVQIPTRHSLSCPTGRQVVTCRPVFTSGSSGCIARSGTSLAPDVPPSTEAFHVTAPPNPRHRRKRAHLECRLGPRGCRDLRRRGDDLEPARRCSRGRDDPHRSPVPGDLRLHRRWRVLARPRRGRAEAPPPPAFSAPGGRVGRAREPAHGCSPPSPRTDSHRTPVSSCSGPGCSAPSPRPGVYPSRGAACSPDPWRCDTSGVRRTAERREHVPRGAHEPERKNGTDTSPARCRFRAYGRRASRRASRQRRFCVRSSSVMATRPVSACTARRCRRSPSARRR